MIEACINSLQLRLGDIRRLVGDLSDQQMTAQPATVRMNPPAWQVGHVAGSLQAIGGEMGLAPWLPETWAARFGQGSPLLSGPAGCPTKEELLAALADGERRIVERLRAMTADDLAGPLPDERFRDVFPTLGHAVLHILAGHTAVHTGQLGAWRRAMGMGAGASPSAAESL